MDGLTGNCEKLKQKYCLNNASTSSFCVNRNIILCAFPTEPENKIVRLLPGSFRRLPGVLFLHFPTSCTTHTALSPFVVAWLHLAADPLLPDHACFATPRRDPNSQKERHYPLHS